MNPLPKVEPVTVPQSIIDAVQACYHIDSKRMLKAVAILQRGELFPLPSGNYGALSHTVNAPVFYQVNPKYKSCTCKNKSNICKHYISYLLLDSMHFEAARKQAITTGQPQVALIHKEFSLSLIKRVPAAIAYGKQCEQSTEQSIGFQSGFYVPRSYEEIGDITEHEEANRKSYVCPFCRVVFAVQLDADYHTLYQCMNRPFRDPIAEREQIARANRPARTEWQEELD